MTEPISDKLTNTGIEGRAGGRRVNRYLYPNPEMAHKGEKRVV